MSWNLAVIVNDKLSPSTLPSLMVDLPNNWLVVSPVSLLPSTLKTKVRSKGPLGPSAVAFQLPLTSAAMALTAKVTIKNGSHFIYTLLFRVVLLIVQLPLAQVLIFRNPIKYRSPTWRAHSCV